MEGLIPPLLMVPPFPMAPLSLTLPFPLATLVLGIVVVTFHVKLFERSTSSTWFLKYQPKNLCLFYRLSTNSTQYHETPLPLENELTTQLTQ
jgi:hypothetical protein